MNSRAVHIEQGVSFAQFADAVGRAADAMRHFAVVMRHREERTLIGAKFAAAKALAQRDPHLDVQLVTTNEGRCRVVCRRLGGWA